MKASALKYFIVSLLASLVSVIIILMPFHAFLTVWGSSLVGHYTALRLWKEVLLLICGIGALYLLIVDTKVRSHTLTRRLIWVIILYGLWLAVRSLFALSNHTVTHKALAYGVLIDTRFLLFFLIAWMVALRTTQLPAQWQRLLLWPAYGVIGVALLQVWVLPNDFLRHVGYGAATIPPVETINNNPNYIRVAATLRGANPLGAYLLLPISLLAVYVVTPLKRNQSHIFILVAALAALACSFSRSAWIGAVISIGIIIAVRAKRLWTSPKLLGLAGALFAALVVTAIGVRHDARFENIFLHTEEHSSITATSNGGHASALKNGLHDMVHQPFGRGPGTAGPASVYNDGKARISENYFLQLGQEAGWFAVGLFLLINVGVGYLLWVRRADPLALSLFAGLIGLSFVNLLSHAWADDTLAYVWWGLAGIAMAQPALKAKKHAK